MLVGSAIFLSPSVLVSLVVMKESPEPLSINALAFCSFPRCSIVVTHVPSIMAIDPIAVLHTLSVEDTWVTSRAGGADVDGDG